MTNTDRYLVAQLDQMHRAVTPKPCRWRYDAARDAYSCPHLEIPGSALADKYWIQFKGEAQP